MADAILSAVLSQLTGYIIEQIRNEVILVWGVKEEVIDLSDILEKIRRNLNDAESRRFKDDSVKDWLKRLEDACYEMEYVLDEWDFTILKHELSSMQKVCSFIPSPPPCLLFKKVFSRSKIAKKIVQVKAQLDTIFKEKERYKFTESQPNDHVDGLGQIQTSSVVEVKNVKGRDGDKDKLLKQIIPENPSVEELGIHVVSVVGSGGIGKTTLAQLVYNDSQVKDFYELRIWICVSDPFNLREIVKGIIKKVKGSVSLDINQLDEFLIELKNSIEGKRFLLVLDDVWTEDRTKWEPLETCLSCGAVGSKVLVTTRNKKVAKMMGCMENDMYNIGVLSDVDCWLLLSSIALSKSSEAERARFNDIGRKIANKCKGLPLAAKVLGSLLQFEKELEKWENVLKSEMWELKETKMDIFPHLLLSYNQLSPPLKRCFSYCAVFPKDKVINVESLIRNWLSLGYLDSDGNRIELEFRGREYFDNLAMRSLFQDFTRDDIKKDVIVECKMHDIVHDFAQFLRKNTSGGEACQICNTSLASRVKEYGSLFFRDEPSSYICDCLARLTVLELVHCHVETNSKSLEKLIHLRHLDLSHNRRLTSDDLKTVFKLYNLKFLLLSECNLKEIPMEIGNLIKLRHLDLRGNSRLKDLPERICDLHELRSLNIELCECLSGLPQGIHKLRNLKHLHILGAFGDSKFLDQVIGQLSGLRTLMRFDGKLSWLKELNQLRGPLDLHIEKISDDEDIVVEAKGAKLFEKVHLDHLTMYFELDDSNGDVVERVLDALKPHPNLSYLKIWRYMGSKLPQWFTSPLQHLKDVTINFAFNLTTLPALGKLPSLEDLVMMNLEKLEFLGREFLGVTKDATSTESSSSSSSAIIGFPKLKILRFCYCPMWREWEDITAGEEASTALSLFPCLKRLDIKECPSISVLPDRLLHKAPSLEELSTAGSRELAGQYKKNKDGSSWKFISHIP